MATDKWVARLEAKINALLEAQGIDPGEFETQIQGAAAPRQLTAAERQAIANAPKAEASVPPETRPPRTTPANAPDTSSSVPPSNQADSGEPWPGYDEASAGDVVERLRGMDAETREQALAYERAHKNRVTITRVNWNG